FVNGIKLCFTTLSYTENDDYTQNLINDFNKYAMENNLDIYIEELLFSSSNITFDGNNYFSIIESSLKRNSKFYDLLMIDIIHTKRLGKYTADLSKYVSKELIDSYTSKSFSKIIYSNNKLVGLKLITLYIYSNKNLLNKYNQTIPETWDELLDTATYILNEEKKIGKKNLIGYLGNFPDEETEMCSAFELIPQF
ncbi:hypothetical protein LY90DRAFT_499673, partial [Neocallimastix californiae]